METGILPDRWAELGEQAIVTAFDILREQAKSTSGTTRQVVDGG